MRQPIYTIEHADYEVDKDYSDLNKFKVLKKGKDVAIIAAGDFLIKGRKVAELLAQKGIEATLINPRFVSGVDKDLLESLGNDHKVVVTLEDGSIEGGFGQRVASALGASDLKVLNFGVEKKFVDRFNLKELEEANKLLPEQITEEIMSLL